MTLTFEVTAIDMNNVSHMYSLPSNVIGANQFWIMNVEEIPMDRKRRQATIGFTDIWIELQQADLTKQLSLYVCFKNISF